MNRMALDEAKIAHDFADMLDEEKRAVDEWLITQLHLRVGDEILETACGTGGAGMSVAAALRPPGRVFCSDNSPERLDGARAVARRRGVTNVVFRRLDAQQLELPACSMDGVVCRLGFQFMSDVCAALSEAHRVLHPGRCLALGVWSEREHNPWRSIPEDVLGLLSSAPGPFALADESLLRRLLTDAGFVDIRVGRVRADHRYSSANGFWTMCMRKVRDAREAFERLDPERRVIVRQKILDRLSERTRNEEGFVVPAEMLMAAGTRRS